MEISSNYLFEIYHLSKLLILIKLYFISFSTITNQFLSICYILVASISFQGIYSHFSFIILNLLYQTSFTNAIQL